MKKYFSTLSCGRFGLYHGASVWLALVCLSHPAPGQTWDGGGADNNWTTVANWNPDGAPANNGTANVIFGGTVRLTPSVNVAQDILSLTFDGTAGSFVIGGANTLTLRAGGITNNSPAVQLHVSCPVNVAAAQTWNTTTNLLQINGAVTLNNNLTIDGISLVALTGPASGTGSITKNGPDFLFLANVNTYTGGTTINAGTLRLQAGGGLSDSGLVTVNSGGTFDLNGNSDTIGRLDSFAGGSITLGAGTLTVALNAAAFASSVGVISGTGNFAKAGTFTQIFGGANTYTGTTNMTNGTLQISANERLADTSDLTINGGLFDLQSFTETVDIVTLTNGQITGTSGTLIGSVYNVESGTIGQHLGGSGTLTKTTAGTVTLTNTSTYSGGTVINAGSLTLGAINALLSTGAVTVNSGGTLVVNFGLSSNTIGALSGNGNVSLLGNNALSVGGGDATSTFSGVISGNGNLGKTGTGTLTLSGANTYQGNTAIFAGELRLGNNNVLSDASGVASNPGATFNLNGFSETIRDLNGSASVLLGSGTLTVAPLAGSFYSGIMSGTGNLTVNGFTVLMLTGANTYTGTTTVSSNILRIDASERLADASDLTVNGGTFDLQSFNETVDVVTLSSGSIIGSGTLSGASYFLEAGTVGAALGGGAGGVNKNTIGNVSLNGVNTYTGSTNINAGELELGASEVIPNGSSVNIASGGTLDLAGFSETVAGVASVGNAGSVLLGSGTLTVGAGDVSTGFGGVMSGSGNLTKVGAGTYSLSGANTYTGTTLVSAGAIKLDASNVLADASDVTVSGGSLDLQSFSDTVDIVTLGSGAITGTGALTGSAYNLQSGTISAPLAGAAALTKSTAGTVTLGASNSYTGGTNLLGGVLGISSDANLGTGGSLTFDAGTLRTTNSFTLNRAITLNAGGGTLDTLATTTLTGTIVGPGGLTKAGLGVLILNIVSPQLAALTVSAGDLDLPVGGSLNVTGAATIGASGFFSVDGGLIIAGNFDNSGEIELLNGARLVGPVSNSGVLGGDGRITGALTNNSAGQVRVGTAETLHFATTSAGSNAGETEVIEGEIEFDGALTNSASTGLIFARDATLRFEGGLSNAGSVALSFGVSDLFGDITNNSAASIVVSGNGDATFIDDVVNNGILRTSAGSVSVFFGAVSGTGSFPGTGTVFFEGDLRPGASPAQISFGGDVVFGSFASVAIEIGGLTPGTQHDKLVIANQASLDGALNVTLIDGFVPTGGDSFTIMTYASRVANFSAMTLPTVPGLRMRLRVDATSATILANFKGDMNCDGLLSVNDIPPFSQAVTDPAGYGLAFATCDILIGDMNDDGIVDGRDISGFTQALLAN